VAQKIDGYPFAECTEHFMTGIRNLFSNWLILHRFSFSPAIPYLAKDACAFSSMTTIRLVEGVVGGFMPAVPRKQILIEIEGGQVHIEKHVKSNAANAVDGYVQTKSTVEAQQVQATVDHCISTLKSLPLESPAGSQDVYKQDVSIFVETDGFTWANVPNQGCDIQESSVQPSSAQIEHFKQIIQKITQLADSHC
jgi:hypothetical protein